MHDADVRSSATTSSASSLAAEIRTTRFSVERANFLVVAFVLGGHSDCDLTAAEYSVAMLVARGYSNADIASRRGTTSRTVANQIASILAKLGVPGRKGIAAALAAADSPSHLSKESVRVKSSGQAIIEAAYDTGGSCDEWSLSLARAATAIDDGLGVIAYRLRENRHIDAFASTNALTVSKDILAATIDALPAEYRDAFLPTRAVTSLSERLGMPLQDTSLFKDWFEPVGIRDALAVVAADGNDALIVLSAPYRRQIHLTHRRRTQLEHIALHLELANRLRQGFASSGFESTSSPLSELRRRACEVDRVHSRSGDASANVDLWHALVSGCWSICDHFDSEGQRFIIARENDPVIPVRGLTEREAALVRAIGNGQSQKLIASELGVSEASVSSSLRALCHQLGASNPAELASLASKLIALG